MRNVMLGSLLAVAMVGCAPTYPAPNYSLAQITPAPILPLEIQPSSRTAYIVLDPARVPGGLPFWAMNTPETVPILADPNDSSSAVVGQKPVLVAGAQDFVTRDLAHALGTYFRDVRVVAPGQPMPGPAVIVDVALDHVNTEVSAIDVGSATWGHGVSSATTGVRSQLTWSIAMRLAESNASLFSFSGQSSGDQGTDPGSAIRSALEHAITDVVQANLNKPEIQAQLTSASGSAS